MVECPADGCSYEGVKSSVLGHYSGKSDDAHPGGYARARSLLADADDPADEQAEDSADNQGGGGDPTMGSADPSPDQGGSRELPCGHESYDPSEAPDPPYRVGCSECGDTWRVTDE